jgi:hypothetical protein
MDDCTSKAKRFGFCWSHGGGQRCQFADCVKLATLGGFCWAHGGGNRCKLDGCERRSYRKQNYLCQRHFKLQGHQKEENFQNLPKETKTKTKMITAASAAIAVPQEVGSPMGVSEFFPFSNQSACVSIGKVSIF